MGTGSLKLTNRLYEPYTWKQHMSEGAGGRRRGHYTVTDENEFAPRPGLLPRVLNHLDHNEDSNHFVPYSVRKLDDCTK